MNIIGDAGCAHLIAKAVHSVYTRSHAKVLLFVTEDTQEVYPASQQVRVAAFDAFPGGSLKRFLRYHNSEVVLRAPKNLLLFPGLLKYDSTVSEKAFQTLSSVVL